MQVRSIGRRRDACYSGICSRTTSTLMCGLTCPCSPPAQAGRSWTSTGRHAPPCEGSPDEHATQVQPYGAVTICRNIDRHGILSPKHLCTARHVKFALVLLLEVIKLCSRFMMRGGSARLRVQRVAQQHRIQVSVQHRVALRRAARFACRPGHRICMTRQEVDEWARHKDMRDIPAGPCAMPG